MNMPLRYSFVSEISIHPRIKFTLYAHIDRQHKMPYSCFFYGVYTIILKNTLFYVVSSPYMNPGNTKNCK